MEGPVKGEGYFLLMQKPEMFTTLKDNLKTYLLPGYLPVKVRNVPGSERYQYRLTRNTQENKGLN